MSQKLPPMRVNYTGHGRKSHDQYTALHWMKFW